MRSASSTAKFLGLFGASLLASAAAAAPVITDWSIKSDGPDDAIRLAWSEPGSFEMVKFEAARQVILTLPEARLAAKGVARLDPGSSRLLERARLQEVTLPSGKKGVQVTLDLREWAAVSASAVDGGLELLVDVPESFVPSEEASVSITDADIAEALAYGYGAADAPATGAGQAEGGDNALSGFFVPPPVKREATPGSAQDVYSLDVERKLDERIRQVDFKDADLLTVLRVIADKGDLNIMVNPANARGKVSLKLRNISFRHMLEALLKANNLGYKVEEGGILRIVPRSQVKTTDRETITKTISINWVDATDLRETLSEFIDDDDGVIEIASASNALVVRDVPENIAMIEDIISKVDIAEKQVLMEVRLVDMTESAARNIGFRTGFQRNEIGNRFLSGTGSVTGTSSATNNFSSDFSSDFSQDFSRDIFGGLDGEVESSFENGVSGGSSMADTLTRTFTDTLARLPESAGTIGALPANANALTLRHLADVTLFGNEYLLDIELRAEETRGEAVILANPTVLSLNNQKALVEIQRKEPYISAVNSDQGSVATISFEEVGTRVELTPRITNNGFVQMRIQPEQRILRGFRNLGVSQTVPLIDERNVTTSVIVRDEQTVALGGLRQFESTSDETGVPYLLRLPVLSWLFKAQSNQQTKTDLYLFVTPHIIKPQNVEITPYELAVYEKIDHNWDLPDYYFDEILPRKSANEIDPRAKRNAQ